MSDLKLPGDDKDKQIPLLRIAIWVIAGGIGAYLLLTGIVGILGNGG